jgi:hypothetical protein
VLFTHKREPIQPSGSKNSPVKPGCPAGPWNGTVQVSGSRAQYISSIITCSLSHYASPVYLALPWLGSLPSLDILSQPRQTQTISHTLSCRSILRSPCSKMGSQVLLTIVVSLFVRVSLCDDIQGYSAFASDQSSPFANATSSSPYLIRDIFARQNGWTCTAGSPFVICPTPNSCCSASDNWQVSRAYFV